MTLPFFITFVDSDNVMALCSFSSFSPFLFCLFFLVLIQIQESNIQLLVPNEEDLTQLRGEVIGPPDTPYEGGRYELEIVIPDSYPFTPPKVRV